MSGFKFTAATPEGIERAFSKALFAAKEQILTDCNFYCRQDQGTLIDSSEANADGMSLEVSWNTPYAKKVYYTGTPSKDVNPNASLMWAEKAKQSFGKEWLAILQKGMNEA